MKFYPYKCIRKNVSLVQHNIIFTRRHNIQYIIIDKFRLIYNSFFFAICSFTIIKYSEINIYFLCEKLHDHGLSVICITCLYIL